MLLFFIFIVSIFIFTILITLRKLYFNSNPKQNEKSQYIKELEAQLNDVDREFRRNHIDEDELKITKLEINKRILREIRANKDKVENAFNSPRFFDYILILAIFPLIAAASLIFYLKVGYYGYEDQPQKFRELKNATGVVTRLNQQQAELLLLTPQSNESPESLLKNENQQLKTLVDRLEIILVDRPMDLQGYNLFVDNSAKIGDYSKAHLAQKHIIEKIKQTVTADDYGKLAELMIGATNGYVSIEAEENIKKSLHLRPSDQRSRYYLGLLELQKNNLEKGYTIWTEVLKSSDTESPYVNLINQDIKRLEQILDGKEQTQESLRESVDNETLDMINNMVSSLQSRLETEGGPYEDWLRLIRSYLVLDQQEKAFESLEKAVTYFSTRPDILDKLEGLKKNLKIEILQ